MSYIKIPNLPEGRVKLAVVDGRISREIEEGFVKQGIELIKTAQYPGVYAAVAYHPDIMFHHIGGKHIVYAPGTSNCLIESLSYFGFVFLQGNTVLTSKYPGNVAYNAARVGNFAIHNLKYTDVTLKNRLLDVGVEFIHVNQGYSKCSISVVDSNSIITSDRGISKAVEKRGIDVLLVEPDENIRLPGLKYGFIGGSTGLINTKTWAITGKIDRLKTSYRIIDFLSRKKIGILELSDDHPVDIGSIIPILTN